jgi:hypothetical protein
MRRNEDWIDSVLSESSWLAVFVMIAVLVACVILAVVH